MGRVRKILAVFLVCACRFNAFAASGDPKLQIHVPDTIRGAPFVRDTLRRCTFLGNSLASAIREAKVEKPEVTLGRFSDVYALLEGKNLTSEEVNRILGSLTTVQNSSQDPLLRQVIQKMNDSQRDENLFVCVLGEGCDPKGFYALYMASAVVGPNAAYGLPTLVESLELNARLGRAVTALPIEPSSAVLLSRPKFKEPQEFNYWVAALVHEFTHYLDHSILTRWMNTNIERLKNGKSADPIFAEQVKNRGPLFLLNPSLRTLLIESRAYYTKLETEKALFAPEQHNALRNMNASLAMKQLRDSIGDEYLKKMTVTEANVMTFWKPYFEEIERTVSLGIK